MWQNGLEALASLNQSPSPASSEVCTVTSPSHLGQWRSHISPNSSPLTLPTQDRADGKRILTEEAGAAHLGFSFSPREKWAILTSVFIVQLSMNFNAAIYPTAVPEMADWFGMSADKGQLGMCLFLVAYAFGCELWAPLSEELGRKWILQASLGLVNIWQLPCIFAENFGTVVVCRVLGGLSSAGGSVTLGMVADMWQPEQQQYACAFVVLSSVAGSVLAPIVGGFLQEYMPWQWVFVVQLIFGGFAQVVHAFVPETRPSAILDKRAKRLRKKGEDGNIYGPNEIRGSFFQRVSGKECLHIMFRPYKLLCTEPIVGFLSLLSGFSDALIFTGLYSYTLVLAKWHFSPIATGLAFTPLLIGYLLAYASFLPIYARDIRDLRHSPATFPPERRLRWLLVLVLLEPLGLFGFAWCSLGPDANVPWIALLIFTALIGIANFAIYMATIDYMVAAYGPYAASATGGNGFCRDLLAGISAVYAEKFYGGIARGTRWQLVIPSFILTGIAVVLCLPVFVFYRWGWWFREKSKYAAGLAREREERRSRGNTPAASRRGSKDLGQMEVEA